MKVTNLHLSTRLIELRLLSAPERVNPWNIDNALCFSEAARVGVIKIYPFTIICCKDCPSHGRPVFVNISFFQDDEYCWLRFGCIFCSRSFSSLDCRWKVGKLGVATVNWYGEAPRNLRLKGTFDA